MPDGHVAGFARIDAELAGLRQRISDLAETLSGRADDLLQRLEALDSDLDTAEADVGLLLAKAGIRRHSPHAYFDIADVFAEALKLGRHAAYELGVAIQVRDHVVDPETPPGFDPAAEHHVASNAHPITGMPYDDKA